MLHSRATSTLLKKLHDNKDVTLFGHQDAVAYGVDWFGETGRSDVLDTCGLYPGVIGWDLGELELGRDHSLDDVSFEFMSRQICELKQSIHTVSWHATHPLTNGDAWDVSRPNTITDLLKPGVNRDSFDIWLTRLATFFRSVAPTPIAFRPFHEMNGDWFWWGGCAESFRALWRYTHGYLSQQGIDNLIWVFAPSTITAQELSHWYPGDDVVDVVGVDDYSNIESACDLEKQIETIIGFGSSRGKLAALTETGQEGLLSSDWFTRVLLPNCGKGLSWALVWRNANALRDRAGHFYAPYPTHRSAKGFREFVSSDAVGMAER